MKDINNDNRSSDSNKGIEIGSNFFPNLSGYTDIEFYTIWGLIDNLNLSILYPNGTMSDNSSRIDINKYYLQAWKLQCPISIGCQPPYVVIRLAALNDLAKRLLWRLDYKREREGIRN